jgi:hypothetical protein
VARSAGAITRLSGLRRITGSTVGGVGFVLAIVLMWVAIFFVDRVFLVEAETSYLDLTFGGEANVWNFDRVTLCAPRETPDLDQIGSGREAVCAPALYEPPAVKEDLTLRWSCGVRVSVRAEGEGEIVVEVLGLEEIEAQDSPCRGGDTRAIATGEEYETGTLFIVGGDDWRTNGALPFQGEATVGEDLGPGATHFLQSGRWEARQTSPVFEALRLHSVTEVVKSGDLSVGAEATIYERGHPALMWGQITPTSVDFERSLPGFDVVMLSAPGKTELRLVHFGFAAPTTIRPDWVDTAITSPLFLAIFAILNLLAVLCQIIVDWPLRLRGTKPGTPGRGDRT